MNVTAPHDLATMRAEIGALSAEILAVSRRPLPMPEALAGIRAQIDRARENFDQAIGTAAIRVAASGNTQRLDDLQHQALEWLCYAHGDAPIADIEKRAAMLREEAGNPATMTATARAQALDALKRRRYDLEVEEEAMVTEQGAFRRPDATAAAVLGIPFEVARNAGVLE